ncbi:NAD(P)H-dependent oxidoreductase [Actinomycetota bacterium Odt1-20B]
MTTLLHLDSSSSPAADSVTRQLTERFVAAWRTLHPEPEPEPEHRYLYRDLSADPVPLISGAYASLGQRVERLGGVALDKVAAVAEDAAEEREWALTLPLVEQLRAADTVLLGVPMYNFTVSAALKAWIDRVSFPGAYGDVAQGASVLCDTRFVLLMARGGAYGPGTPREGCDFQTPYLRAYFTQMLGVPAENLHFVAAEMTRAWDIPALARFQDLAVSSRRRADDLSSDLAAICRKRP